MPGKGLRKQLAVDILGYHINFNLEHGNSEDPGLN